MPEDDVNAYDPKLPEWKPPKGRGPEIQEWESARSVRTPDSGKRPKPRSDKSPSKFPPVPQKRNS